MIDFKDLYFYEPRLEISIVSRFLARLIFYSFYVVLAIAAVTFIISDIKQLFWIGALIFLFLSDRLLHWGEAEKSIIGLTRALPRLSRRQGGEAIMPENINVALYLRPASFSILERAYDKTLLVGGDFYLYLLKFLVQLPDIKAGLARMDVPMADFEKKIEESIEAGKNEEKKSKEDLLQGIEVLAKAAFLGAMAGNNRFIDPRDLFSALGTSGNSVINRLFSLFEINLEDLAIAMIFGKFNRSFWKRYPRNFGEFINQSKKLRHRTMNRAWTSRPTPTLDAFSVDFTDLARSGVIGFLIGHSQEYDRLVDILSRPNKPNALLIGEPGIGKETIIGALAFAIIKDEVPEAIFDKRLVSLSIGNLISGAQTGDISARLNKIVEEIVAANNIILYIPDIHNLVKTSNTGMINAADILLPIINNDAFPIVGSTFSREFKEFIELNSDFSSVFEIIKVEEISESDAVKFLVYDSLILEKQFKTIISLGAIKQSVFLARKYFHQKFLPSSAEDLLKETLSYTASRNDKLVQADDVIAVAQRKINIPLSRVGKEEAEKLLNLENIIHVSLIDQEAAVFAVARALREYRSGLSRQGGPIAVFLFVGPTGVGKTELSKILAKIQFGSEDLMVRFDMSEYQNKESIARFIGSADGKMAGALTEAIIQKPYSLILLDEFEKAHPDILNLFLQVFDDGRLTDSLDRTVDFTNTIIIATSNAHSNFIKEQIEVGEKIEKIGEELKKKLTKYFKPELLNRFSQIVVFKNLSPVDIEAIARLQLKSLAKTLEQTNGINLIFEEAVIKKISELGYDPVFGARPLRGVISEKLRSVLAEKILKEEIVRGDNVRASLENNEIKFV